MFLIKTYWGTIERAAEEKLKMLSPTKTQRGFTLTELLVTMAVAVILTVIAASSFADYFQKARVRAAADALTDILSYARSEAIKRDRQVSVTIGGSAVSWCAGARSAADPAVGSMVQPATACNCKVDSACLVGTDQVVVDGSQFNNVVISAVGGSVVFDGKLGTLSDLTPAELRLTSSADPRFVLQVGVGATGLSAICVPSTGVQNTGIPSCT